MKHDDNIFPQAPPAFYRFFNYSGSRQVRECIPFKDRLKSITLQTLIAGLENRFSQTFKRK